MKKTFTFFLAAILCFAANAQLVTTWQGPSSGGSWTNPANWSNGVPTAPATEIKFDGAAGSLTGGVVTITDVTAQTNAGFSFDKLTIVNNATVNLSGAGQIYWYFGISLYIEAGSRLNVGASTTTLFAVGGTLSTVINIDGILDLQGQGNSSNYTSFEPTNVTFGSSVSTAIRGTVILSGTNARLTPNSNTPNFESGSKLDITRNGGFVPKANYKNGSLIKIEGVVGTAPNFTNSAVYDGVVEWNSPGQLVSGSSAIILPGGSFSYFDSLVINNTGAGGNSVRLATTPNNYYVKNIIMNNGILEFGSPGGSGHYVELVDTIIQNGGTLVGNAPGVAGFDNAFEPDTLNVTGKFIQNGGTFDFSTRTPVNTTPNASFVLQVAGEVKIGGIVKLTSIAAAPNCALVFNGNSTQNFSVTGAGVFSNKIKTVINNSSLLSGVNLVSNVILPDSLVFTVGYLYLNNFDLTNPLPVQAVPNPFATHAVTNGTGFFIQKNVGIAPVGFPFGASANTVNPLIMAFSAGVLDVAAKVDIGLNPTVVFPNIAVNRTWRVKPLGTPPSNLAVSFGYTNVGPGLGDGNPGFSYTANDEVGLNDGTAWQVISLPGGYAPAGSNPYAISHVILSALLAANVATPLAIGNITAITPISNIIRLQAVKNGSSAALKWSSSNLTNVLSYEVLRSADGSNFSSIGNVSVQNNQLAYIFADNNLLAGVNYYKIKMIETGGIVKYSVVVAVINKESGSIITSVLPSLVTNQATIMLSSATKTTVQFTITDMQGRVVKRTAINAAAGNNEVLLNCSNLPAGSYYINGFADGIKTNSIGFVKQ